MMKNIHIILFSLVVSSFKHNYHRLITVDISVFALKHFTCIARIHFKFSESVTLVGVLFVIQVEEFRPEHSMNFLRGWLFCMDGYKIMETLKPSIRATAVNPWGSGIHHNF